MSVILDFNAGLSVCSLTAQDNIGYEYSFQLKLIINERELAFESVAFYRILDGLPLCLGSIKKRSMVVYNHLKLKFA